MVSPIQGLRVINRASDIGDPIEALKNINVNILDLDRIRGIQEEGVLPEDIITLSGLTSDFEKEIVGVYDEMMNYSNYLSALNDGRVAFDGNMTANASLIAASFKFNTLASNNTLISSDLSTSRVSAWSSLGSSLYYGAKVSVGSQVELSSLTIDRPIKPRRFESEVPTHKVRIRVDGIDYDAYAMKNMPVKFTGYFSSVRNIYFTVNNAGPGPAFLRPSWVVIDADGTNSVTFQNRLSGSGTNRNSIISVLGSRAKERDIEFYYPVSNIIGMVLPNAKLYSFPSVVFPSLTTATLSGSDFKEIPDFRRYTPSLLTLDISNVNLMRSNDLNLRSFNNEVVSRLPTTLTRLTIDRCFAGEASANLAIIDNLSFFSAVGDYNTGMRMTGVSPAVNPVKIDTYRIRDNLFSELHPSVRTSDTLRVLDFSFNNLSVEANTSISPTNNVIEEIIHNGNRSQFINVSGKTSLKLYHRSSSPASGVITDLFTGCTSLADIRVFGTNATGRLPSFSTNRSLAVFYAWSTRIQGADATYAIAETTFGSGPTSGCRETLKEFNLTSPLLTGEIHPNALDNLTALISFALSSTLNGVSGGLPEFRQSSALRSVNFRQNNLSGAMHSFSNNPRLTTINLGFNKLNGSVPILKLSSLLSLVLNNNNFTGVGVLECPSLRELNLSFNSITSIPSFSGAKSLQTISMSSNPMTSEAAYTPDTFTELTALKFLDLSNCNMTRAVVNQILLDLAKNYDLSPRVRVEVNLTGNAQPSPSEEIQTFTIARLRSAGWTIRVS